MRSISFLAAILLCACSTMPIDQRSRAAGHYFAPAIESERTLDLLADGTFLMVLHLQGDNLQEVRIEERGTWVLQNDVVSLSPEDGSKYDDTFWYSRLLLRGVQGRRSLRCGVRRHSDYGKFGFAEVEEDRANPESYVTRSRHMTLVEQARGGPETKLPAEQDRSTGSRQD